MGILDDAIREHLDLKRKHGARDAELREIEDEAFGSADQPDPFTANELFTEVGSAVPEEAGNEEPTRLVEAEAIELTEEPEAPEPPTSDESIGTFEPPSDLEPSSEVESTSDFEPTSDVKPPSQIPGQAELPGQDEIPGQERLEDELPPASESLEELIAEEEPFPEDTAAPPPATAPAETDSEADSRPLEPDAAAEAPSEPEISVPDPPPPPPEPGSEPPGRARGRVDVPTQEHPPPGDTGGLPALPGDEQELGRPDTSYEPPPMDLPPDEPPSDEQPLPSDEPAGSEGPALYDFETDEDPVPPATSEPAVDDDFEALGPAEEEAPYLDEEEPYPEEPQTAVRPPANDEEDTGERSSFEDRLEEEEGEEGLWFEKGPPKDFDFDD
jgi:hypothetical protein